MTPNEYIRKLQEDNKMSCKLTYEELHERYHDAADENKELRQVLAKMSTLVTSEVPSGIFQNYLQEENDRLALSVETFRRHQEKDSDKKKNLHDYLVTVLGYNQEQIMEIMESGAMLSNDPGVGYKFEHDFGKEHALDVSDDDTQIEMDFDNPDEGMVNEKEDDGISTERHPRHVYAHMGYSR